ncbi:putative transcription factor bHLH041 [Panicum virgatum]|nr:putative transcription factor bHLH041 [Panicum virgatum]
MDMEDDGHSELPSSQSSTFPAASSAIPDETSSLVLGSSNLDTIPNLEELIACQEGLYGRDQRRNGHARGAFMPYSRHLGTKKKPKPGSGAGGQRAIKAAMSALARMHMVRLAQWQRYQMEMAVAPSTAGSSCGNQLQHVLSERKRREKLNDSFKALKTVLPPAPKKDKASILIRARDYVNTLKSRLSELEERNRTLEELMQHQCDDGGDRDDVSDEQIDIEVDINRAAAAEETSQEFHLKIVVRSGYDAMDAVLGILECLKELGDVRLATMDTGSRATTLALQMKTSGCDDNFLKESVIKSVKGVMQSKIETA